MPFLAATKQAQPLPSAELNLGGTSTAEGQFVTASATGVALTGSSLVCYLPGSNVLKNRRFQVSVGGRVTGGGGTNFTAKLYLGTSATVASNALLASTGAVATAGNTGTWCLEMDLAWHGPSGTVNGVLWGWVAGVAVAQAVMSTSASQVITTLNTESTNNGLTVTGQFSSGFATNQAYVDWFEVVPK